MSRNERSEAPRTVLAERPGRAAIGSFSAAFKDLGGRRAALRAATIIVSLFLLSMALPSPSSASGRSLEFLSPGPDALVTHNRLVVRFAIGEGVTHPRLRVAGQAISSRPLKGHPGEWQAKRPVKGLPKGRIAVVLEAQRGGRRISSVRTVVLGRHAPGLLRDVHLPRHAAGAVELRVRLGGPTTDFAVRVDGRPVHLLRYPSQPAPAKDSVLRLFRKGHRIGSRRLPPLPPTIIPLSADDGLRPGANRIAISAYQARSGAWARVEGTVWVSRSVPLAAAGRDRKVLSGKMVRLDGDNSRPARPGEHLTYRWRIVSRPHASGGRSPARLLHRHSVRPLLSVGPPGIYRVALHVAGEHSPSSTPGGTAQASSVEDAEGSSDYTTLEESRSVSPWGTPATIGRHTANGALRTTIEGVELESENHQDWVEVPEGQVQVIILDRSTLTVDSVEAFPGMFEALHQALGADQNHLAIVTGRNNTNLGFWLPGWPVIVPGDEFSLVVSDGRPIAYNVGEELGEGERSIGRGAISGLFRQEVDSAGDDLYTFIFPEAVEFDTYFESEGKVKTNVDGDLTSAEPSGGAGQAIAITALGPALAELPQLSGVFPLPGGSEDASALGQVAARLSEIETTDHGGVLLLQTIGDPKPEGADRSQWSGVGQQLRGFGGTPAVWGALDGSGNYALVGTVYGPDESGALRATSSAEASGPMEGGGLEPELGKWVGTLRGVIGRGEDGLPILRESTSLPTTRNEKHEQVSPGELTLLAEAAPTAWQVSGGPILEWISEQLKLGDPEVENDESWCFTPSTWNLRAEYCNTNLAAEWAATYKPELAELEPKCQTKWEPKACEELISELKAEFDEIDKVHALIENLRSVVTGTEASVGPATIEAGEEVEAEIVTPKSLPIEEVSLSPQALVDGVTGALQDVSFELPGASVLVGLLEGAINLGFDSSETSPGVPTYKPFVPEKGKIGSEALARLQSAVTGLGEIEELLYGDPEKLEVAADYAVNIWSLDPKTVSGKRYAMQRGVEGSLYETMLSKAYGLWEASPEQGTTFEALKAYRCYGETGRVDPQPYYFNPFKEVSEKGFVAEEGENSVLVIANTTAREYAQTPGEGLTDRLFGPVGTSKEEKGLGLYQAPFFTWGWEGPPEVINSIIAEGKSIFGYKPNECY